MPTADLCVAASDGDSAAELSGYELLLAPGVCSGFLDCFLSNCKTLGDGVSTVAVQRALAWSLLELPLVLADECDG